MKPIAMVVTCSTDEQEHMNRDYCGQCAPGWWRIMVCPDKHGRLTPKGFCQDCKKYYDITNSKR